MLEDRPKTSRIAPVTYPTILPLTLLANCALTRVHIPAERRAFSADGGVNASGDSACFFD